MIRELDQKDIDIINKMDLPFDNFRIDKEQHKSDPYLKIAVYIKENQIIGFISYSIIYERAEINYIFVQKEYRLNKIASSLLNYMFKMCMIQNIEDITLEVREDNISAINLYKKHDFKEITKRKNYYQGIDGILMLKKVSE